MRRSGTVGNGTENSSFRFRRRSGLRKGFLTFRDSNAANVAFRLLRSCRDGLLDFVWTERSDFFYLRGKLKSLHWTSSFFLIVIQINSR